MYSLPKATLYALMRTICAPHVAIHKSSLYEIKSDTIYPAVHVVVKTIRVIFLNFKIFVIKFNKLYSTVKL